VQEQIDATVKDAISAHRAVLPQGASLTHCAECGSEIPQARQEAIPGVRFCLPCQEAVIAPRRSSPAITAAAARTVSFDNPFVEYRDEVYFDSTPENEAPFAPQEFSQRLTRLSSQDGGGGR